MQGIVKKASKIFQQTLALLWKNILLVWRTKTQSFQASVCSSKGKLGFLLQSTLHCIVFAWGDIRENVVLWKMPAVTLHPVTLQHHGTIRACYKAGLLLLVVDAVSVLCRRTQCPVLTYGCKIISRPRWLCY